MIFFLTFAFFALFIVLVWLAGLLYANNFFLPSMKTETFARALLIYPHPDDEVLSAGGLIRKVVDRGANVTLVTLTEGEKSQRSGLPSETLRGVRKREFEKATSVLGITKVIQADYGDKELQEKYVAVKTFIARMIEEEQPYVVITYDLSGLYGHPDHIVCSEIVTELITSSYPDVLLLYNTYPTRALSTIRLREEIKRRQARPNLKLFIGWQLFAKMRAFYMYKSQLESFRRGIPSFIPLWFAYSLFICEYYYAVPSQALLHHLEENKKQETLKVVN